jgi:enoyl-CoA hydratase/carnithine racemase
MPSELSTERHGAVLVLTLREPGALNRLSQQLVAAFAEALDVADGDPEVACIVVRGDGANFCTGADIGALPADGDAADGSSDLLAGVDQLVEALQVFPKPVLAAVEGAAAGSGFALAMGCDLVVAARDAQFALGFGPGALGQPAQAGAVWQLSRAMPAPLLQQMVWLGEPIDASRLHACGLVGWVCDSGRALAEALRIADRLAASPARDLAAGKELVQEARRRSARRPLGGPQEPADALGLLDGPA